jgi:hypothetical protein
VPYGVILELLIVCAVAEVWTIRESLDSRRLDAARVASSLARGLLAILAVAIGLANVASTHPAGLLFLFFFEGLPVRHNLG